MRGILALVVGLVVGAFLVTPTAMAQRPAEYSFGVGIYAGGVSFGVECDGEDDIVDRYETDANVGQGQFRLEPAAKRWNQHTTDLTAETFVYYDMDASNGEAGRQLQWTNLVHYGPYNSRAAWSTTSELKQDRQPYWIDLRAIGDPAAAWPRPGEPIKWEIYQVFRDRQSGPILAQCEAEVLVTDES